MLTIEPTGAVLGATARGIDLAQPLSERGRRQSAYCGRSPTSIKLHRRSLRPSGPRAV